MTFEDALWWEMTFDGKWLLMEDNLWWKTTFVCRRPLIKDDLETKTQKKFETQNLFWTQKLFLIQIIFWIQNSFGGPKFILCPIYCWTIFGPKIFSSDPYFFFKSFQAEHFRLESCYILIFLSFLKQEKC